MYPADNSKETSTSSGEHHCCLATVIEWVWSQVRGERGVCLTSSERMWRMSWRPRNTSSWRSEVVALRERGGIVSSPCSVRRAGGRKRISSCSSLTPPSPWSRLETTPSSSSMMSCPSVAIYSSTSLLFLSLQSEPHGAGHGVRGNQGQPLGMCESGRAVPRARWVQDLSCRTRWICVLLFPQTLATS